MVTEKDLHSTVFNITRAEISLKALYLLDRLIDPRFSEHVPADFRRELRLAAATVLRVRDADIDDDTRDEVTRTITDVHERIANGEKFTPDDIRRLVHERFGITRQPPQDDTAAPAGQPTAPTTMTPATITESQPYPEPFPDLPGALVAETPSAARTLRDHAGANTAPVISHGAISPAHTKPLKHARPPPPMKAA